MDINMSNLIEAIAKEVAKQSNFTAGAAPVATDKPVNTYIDHTVLAANTPLSKIEKFCKEAIEYKFASVCFNPIHVKYAAERLKGTGVNVCTVIGFPLGANTPFVKAVETIDAIANGAQEIDMVANIGAIKDCNWALVKDDIAAVVKAANGTLVKVIIETCLLTDEEKFKVSQICVEAGAQFVKTSTGFSTGGATAEDVALIRKAVGPTMGIKASGGVRNMDDAKKMIAAGATRIGTSGGIGIISGNSEHKCTNCGRCKTQCPSGNVTITKNVY